MDVGDATFSDTGAYTVSLDRDETTKTIALTAGDAVFNSSLSQSFLIASASAGITGFDPSVFALSLTNFSNTLGAGSFAIENIGNDINLVFTTASTANTGVSEPSTFTLAGLGFLILLKRRRRRK